MLPCLLQQSYVRATRKMHATLCVRKEKAKEDPPEFTFSVEYTTGKTDESKLDVNLVFHDDW